MIGQSNILQAVERMARASKQTATRPKNLAFEASRGMGKTLMMQEVARMLELTPIETAFKRGTHMDKAVNVLRYQWRPSSCWIIDELHNASIPNQMALKKLVESGIYVTNIGDTITIPNLVVVAAFTDRSLIDPEFLDRFTVYRLVPYSFEERLEILFSYAKAQGIEISYDDAEMIVCSNDSPRSIVKAMHSAFIIHTLGEPVTHQSIFAEQQKDSDGLDYVDRQMLVTIADLLGSQVKATLDVLSDKVRLSTKATNNLLSRLSSMGFVKTTPGLGRTLTDLGWQKVDAIRAEN